MVTNISQEAIAQVLRWLTPEQHRQMLDFAETHGKSQQSSGATTDT